MYLAGCPCSLDKNHISDKLTCLRRVFFRLIMGQFVLAFLSPVFGQEVPANSPAAKVFAKALKEQAEHKMPSALEDFRRADQLAGGHCRACEQRALGIAKQIQDFKTAHEEATLLLAQAVTPDDRAEAHYLSGEIYLAEGGNKIFEEPFRQADSEFTQAIDQSGSNIDYFFEDGIALSHLHRYDMAKTRFQHYVDAARGTEIKVARAKLFLAKPELARKRMAPPFQVMTLDGKKLSGEQLGGKVVLLDFWATWCGPCKIALPKIKEIATKYAGQNLVVISVSLDESEETWKRFVSENDMTWAQYRDGSFEGPISSAFGVRAVPTTFTIDTDGFLQDQQVGSGKIETTIKELLQRRTETAE